MRGKPSVYVRRAVKLRIIPARAGQTSVSGHYDYSHSDHPRACGANLCRPQIRWMNTGSSPRVRGKPGLHTDRRRCRRIIPARAGQTHARNQCGPGDTDHPRACGANCTTTPPNCTASGSSPRVRGKHVPKRAQNPVGRIIPARAGQTHGFLDDTPAWPDHPRACGANGVGRLA